MIPGPFDLLVPGFHLYFMPEDLRLRILAKLPEHAEIVGLVILNDNFDCRVSYAILPNDERRFQYDYKFDGDANARKRITAAIEAAIDKNRQQRR